MKHETAGLGARALAYVLDWHIRIFVCGLLFLGLVMLDLDMSELGADPFSRHSLTLLEFSHVFVPLLIFFLYHPLLEILMRGATPGKRWVGIHIVTEAGEQPSVLQHFVRNVLRLIDCLPFCYGVASLVMLYGKSARRWGDMASGTKVVYQRSALDIG